MTTWRLLWYLQPLPPEHLFASICYSWPCVYHQSPHFLPKVCHSFLGMIRTIIIKSNICFSEPDLLHWKSQSSIHYWKRHYFIPVYLWVKSHVDLYADRIFPACSSLKDNSADSNGESRFRFWGTYKLVSIVDEPIYWLNHKRQRVNI